MPETTATPTPEPAEQWCVAELMGHNVMAGRLTEEERFGGVMARIDVPQSDGSFATSYFASQSVFRLTIVTEAAARKVAERAWPRPVQPYEPKALTAGRISSDPYSDDDDDRDFDPDDDSDAIGF